MHKHVENFKGYCIGCGIKIEKILMVGNPSGSDWVRELYQRDKHGRFISRYTEANSGGVHGASDKNALTDSRRDDRVAGRSEITSAGVHVHNVRPAVRSPIQPGELEPGAETSRPNRRKSSKTSNREECL